jgi:hypothetical protein
LPTDEFTGFICVRTASVESKAEHAGLNLAPIDGQGGVASGKDGADVGAAFVSAQLQTDAG